MSLTQPLIELNNVSFRYDHEQALENVSFSLSKGDYLGIIGPNGGGKTTLLKIILGLLEPSSGTVKIFGRDISEIKNRFEIGYVPQMVWRADSSFPATVWEIVASGRTPRIGLFKNFTDADRQACEQAMATAEIGKFRHRLITDLSGGERQRVFIARALAGEPQVLILDEPTTGVDIASQEKFYNFLSGLNKNSGLSIILVSHDVDIVADEVKTVLCVNQKLVYHGAPKDFMTEEHLAELYGKRIKFVLHGH